MNENESQASGVAGTQATFKQSRLTSVLRGVAALVACGALLCWAALTVWESRHPELAAARGLKAGNPADRLAAIRSLSEVGTTADRTVIPALTTALADDDPRVRTAAAESLGLITSFAIRASSGGDGIPAAVSGLVRLLKDPESGVRIAAVHALMTIASTPTGGGGRTAPKSGSGPPPSPIDFKQLAGAFGEMLDDPDTEARLAALQGLGATAAKLGDEPPPGLVKALDDPVPANRAAAITSLARFKGGRDSLLPAAVRSLAENGTPELQTAGVQALKLIQPSSVSAAQVSQLVSACKNPDPDIRYEIIVLLSRIGANAREAIPAFINALNEPTDTDRSIASPGPRVGNPLTGPAYVAAQALGEIAPRTPAAGQAVTALTEVLRSALVKDARRRPAHLAALDLKQLSPSPHSST